MTDTTPAREGLREQADILRRLAGVIRQHGIVPPAALEEVADRIAALTAQPVEVSDAPGAAVDALLREYRPSMDAEVLHSWARDVLAAIAALAPRAEVETPRQEVVQEAFTTGHCENKKKPGGCPLHNLHCGWPKCDRREVASQKEANRGR